MDPGRLDLETGSASRGRRGGPQRIPRPADAGVGRPAPWLGRPPGVITVSDVRLAMGIPWTTPTTTVPPGGVERRPAAVLCAVFDDHGQAEVVLTRRSAGLRSHTSEVSFPGGRIDPGEQPLAAALREANEEVGIDPATVEVIGRLSPVFTPMNPAPIHPFVGVLSSPPTLRPNPAEVERAFMVPLVELFAPEVGTEELWPQPDGGVRRMHLFALVGDTVWGATARMLRELMERLWAVRVAE